MKIRVLVIDDDEDLLFLAGKFLAKEDERIELVSANTDQEALQLLEEEEFDAIVCDHYLGPHSMTGLDLLEWVREGHPHIPFIIFTGRSQEAVAIRALNLGADYYLKKGTDEFRELFIDIAHRIRTEVENRRTEEALSRAYEELERRVEERTTELQKANEQLLKEISERQKIEDALILQRELGNVLCKTTSFSEAFDGILKTAVKLDGVDCGGIYLADTKTGDFDLSSSQGISAHFLSKFSGEDGPASIKEPFYLSAEQIQSSTDVEDQYKDLTAVAIVPVIFEDRTTAVLSLGSHTFEEIPQRDRHTLEAIGVQIAAYMARMKAERTIVETQSEMNEVFDALDDLLIMTDTDYRIISANKVAKRYLGLSTDCLETDSIAKIFSLDEKEQDELLHRVLSEKVVRLENELQGKEGKALRVDTRVTTTSHDNRQILYFVSRLKSAQ